MVDNIDHSGSFDFCGKLFCGIVEGFKDGFCHGKGEEKPQGRQATIIGGAAFPNLQDLVLEMFRIGTIFFRMIQVAYHLKMQCNS